MRVLILALFLSCACVFASADFHRRWQNKELLLSVQLGVVSTDILVINFTLSNPSNAPVRFLPWGTPLEGDIYGPIFRVFNAKGEEIPYIGKVARRAPVTPDAYKTLAAGSSVSTTVDISSNYEMLLPGEYSIAFRGAYLDSEVYIARSNPIIAKLDEMSINNALQTRRAPESTNCRANEVQQVNAAVSGALTESRAAYNCMNARSCDSLSTRWFGTYNQGNYDYDKRVFQSVANRLQNYAFNAYCNPAGCGSNIYGYVYPTDPSYTVYLCGAFWSQPNERINTVVHEMSHFNTLGGTQDYAYGKPNCLNLARTNPARASRNADNVCYFSEEAKLFMMTQPQEQ